MTNTLIPRVEIREVCSTFSGGTPSRARAENYGSEHPWIKSGELNQRRIWSTSESISDAGLNTSSAKYVEPETNLVALYGATAGVVSKSMIRATINQAILAIVPRAASLDNEFLFYAMEYIMPLSLRNLQGAQPNLSGKIVNDLLIPHPPLPEQKKIAEILGACDEAIEAQERLIAQKQQRKKGLMQKLLTGDVRFPEFEGSPWREVNLGEIVKPLSRKNTAGNTNVLTSSAKHGLVSQIHYFNKSVAGIDTSKYYLLKRGEFAYNRSSSIGYPYGAIKRLDLYDEGVLSTLYVCFSIKGEAPITSDFLKFVFEAGLLNRGLQAVCQEGARAHGLLNIIKSDFYGLSISVPVLKEQEMIGDLLNAVGEEITLQKQQLEQLKQQKKGLMQQLLTGKVRVKV